MWYITRRYIRHTVWGWGPVLAAILIMFIASAQPKYGPPPGTRPLTIYFSGAMPVFPGLWEFAIKKSAHMVAYGMLTLLGLRALVGWSGMSRRKVALAIGMALTYALIDEFHQSFVPGRHASLMDIGLDLGGATIFGVVAWWWHMRQNRVSDRNRTVETEVHGQIAI
jgi:hypothetical protein